MPEDAYETIMKLLNLDKSDAKAYSAILMNGFGTVAFVAQWAGINEKKAQACIEKLEQNGYLKKVPGVVERWIPVRPFNRFISFLDKFNSEIKNNLASLNSMGSEATGFFKSIMETSESLVANLINEYKGYIETNNGASVDQFNKKSDDVLAKLENLKMEISKKIETSVSGIDAEFKKYLDEKLSETGTSIEGLIKQFQAAFDKAINESLNQFNEYEAKQKTVIGDLSSMIKKDYESLNSIVEQQIAKAVTTIDEALTQQQTKAIEYKTKVKTQTEKVAEEVKGFLSKTEQDIENSLKQYRNELLSILQTLDKDLTSDLTALETKLKANVDEKEKTIRSQAENFKNSVLEKIKEVSAQVEASKQSTIKSLQETANTLVETINKSTGEYNTEIQSKVSEMIAESVKKVQELGTSVKGDVSKLISDKLEQFKGASSKFKEFVTTAVQKEIQRYKTEVRQSLEKIQNAYIERIEVSGDEYQKAYNDTLNDIIIKLTADLKKIKQDFEAEIEKKTESQIKSLNELKNTIIEKTKTSSESLAKSNTTIVSEKIKAAETEVNGNAEGFLNLLNNSSSELITKVDTWSKEVETNANSMNSESKAIISKHLESIHTQSKQKSEIISKSVDEFNSSLNSSVSGATAGLKETCVSMLGEQISTEKMPLDPFKSSLEGSKSTAIKAIQESGTQLLQSVSNLQNQIEQYMKGLPSTVKDNYAKVSEDLSKALDGLKQRIGDLSTQMRASFGSNVSKVSKALELDIQSTRDEISADINTSKSATNELTAQLVKINQSKAEEIKAKIIQMLKDTEKNLTGKFNSTIENAKKPLQDAINESGGPLDLLMVSWDSILASKPLKAEATWIIAGYETIQEYMKKMIETATIDVYASMPKFDEFDWKTIIDKQKKEHVKFRIYTDVLSTTNSKQPQKVIEGGIDLYHTQTHSFLVVRKDAKQVLIAPIDTDWDRMVAIVSEANPFVETLFQMVADLNMKFAKKHSIQ
jgi:uncharacterized membrane-anchored protein YjiN (DUF445 family)